MTKSQHIEYCEQRVPGTCPAPGCTATTSSDQGGNDWYCAAHYAEVLAMSQAENDARNASQAALRSNAARAAAETRRLKDGSTSHNGVRTTRSATSIAAGQAKYRDIKERYTRSMGW